MCHPAKGEGKNPEGPEGEEAKLRLQGGGVRPSKGRVRRQWELQASGWTRAILEHLVRKGAQELQSNRCPGPSPRRIVRRWASPLAPGCKRAFVCDVLRAAGGRR